MGKALILLLLLLGPTVAQAAKVASDFQLSCDEPGMIMECCRKGAVCSMGMGGESFIASSAGAECSCALQPLENESSAVGISTPLPIIDAQFSAIEPLAPVSRFIQNQIGVSRGNPPPHQRPLFLLNTSLLL